MLLNCILDDKDPCGTQPFLVKFAIVCSKKSSQELPIISHHICD